VAETNIRIVISSQSGDAVAGINNVSNSMRNLQGSAKTATKTAAAFGSALEMLTTPIATLGVGLRQIGQALQGFAFLTTAFVSVPMAAALNSMAKEAINFDDALVRAQKTTGLLDDQVGRLTGKAGTLSGELRNLAQNVATPLSELAQLAEQAGQLGVQGVDNIMRFVRVAEVLGQTTDIAATDALETFGRLAKALGVDSDRAGEYIMQLANTINILENTTTASASVITQAMMNAISAASGFKIAGADLAAFVSSLYDMGVGAREAGTMFSRMASYVTTRIDDLADFTGLSVAEIRKAFDQDFVGGLLGVLRAIGDIQSESEQMAVATEIFGMRAARGVILLANQYDDVLVPTLERARKEFESGSSIINEYTKAMSSTKAQIGILQNSLRVLAVTIGDALLPVINLVLKYVVPAVQMAAEAFAGLNDKTKVLIIAGAGLLAVLGPVAMIFGTLAFGVGIALTGIINLATAMGAAAGAVVPLIGGILKIGAALVGLAIIAQDGMEAVRDVILRYADAAESWGANLVGNLAAGMLRGIAAVINAAISIANAIAGFFRSFSPPKMGPLRDILKWGQNLIETYIEGFGKADFSAIEDVTNTIASYFRSLGRLGMIDEGDIVPAIIDVRHAFTELLAVFEETGSISDDILRRISERTGDLGDKVARWLKLQIQVTAAQKTYDDAIEKLRQIRDLREQINNTYKRQVRSITKSGKPLLEQLSMIVQARSERDDQLDKLDDEEAAQKKIANEAKSKLDEARDLLDTQRGLIDFYLKELDLLAEQKDAMKGIAGGAKSAAGSIDELAGSLDGIDFGGVGDLDDTIRAWEDLIKGIEEALGKFKEGRKTLEAFFAGLRGEYLVQHPELLSEGLTPDVAGAISFGRDIRGVFDEIVEKINKFKESIGGLADSISEIKIENISQLDEKLGNIGKYIPDVLGLAAGFAIFVSLMKNFGISIDGLAAFERILANIGKILGGFLPKFLVLLGDFGAFIQLAAPFVAIFAAIAIAIAAFVTAIIENFNELRGTISQTFESIVSVVGSEGGLGDALANLGRAFQNLGSVVMPVIGAIWRVIVAAAHIIIDGFVGGITAALPGLVTIFAGVVNTIAGIIDVLTHYFQAGIALLSGDIEGFKEHIDGVINGIANIVIGVLQALAGSVQVILNGIEGIVSGVFQAIYEEATGKVSDFSERVVEYFGNMSEGVNEAMTQIHGWIVDKLTAARDKVMEVLESIRNAFKELYDKVVNHSYVPDMAKGVEKWFGKMTATTGNMIADWTATIGGDIGTMSVTATLAPAYAPMVTGIGANGPLVQIDKMIVPNQQVASVFADELSDRLGRLAGMRSRRS